MLENETFNIKEREYYRKNDILSVLGESNSPYGFYEDLFGDLSVTVPYVVSEGVNDKHLLGGTLDTIIDFASLRNDVYLPSCTFFKDWYAKKNARSVYGFCIDCDSVYSDTLRDAFQNGWDRNSNSCLFPTYIINSGTGLHLYFILSRPVPCYSKQLDKITNVYRTLAAKETSTFFIGQKTQILWFGQSFRVVGSRTKDDFTTRAFKVGHTYTIEDIAIYYDLDYKFEYQGEFIEKKEKPKTNNIRRKYTKEHSFKTNRAFYDYTLREAKHRTIEGQRYLTMCALTVIGYKCGIDRNSIESDLRSLLPIFNDKATKPIKDREITSALKMYNEKAVLTRRESLEAWLGWKYEPKVKRRKHPLKQEEHLALARQRKDEMRAEGTLGKEGRPSKEQEVVRYIEQYPEAKKSEVAKALGVSRPTIDKYWPKKTEKVTISKEEYERLLKNQRKEDE